MGRAEERRRVRQRDAAALRRQMEREWMLENLYTLATRGDALILRDAPQFASVKKYIMWAYASDRARRPSFLRAEGWLPHLIKNRTRMFQREVRKTRPWMSERLD